MMTPLKSRTDVPVERVIRNLMREVVFASVSLRRKKKEEIQMEMLKNCFFSVEG